MWAVYVLVGLVLVSGIAAILIYRNNQKKIDDTAKNVGDAFHTLGHKVGIDNDK